MTINRRQFLLAAAGSVTLAGCETASESDSSAGPAQERIVNAGPAATYGADGVYTGFRHRGFFLVRKGESLTAISAICTHKKCKLKAEKDHSFYCPCHGSTFAPDGKVTLGPARRDLPVFATFTDDRGQLFVRVPSR